MSKQVFKPKKRNVESYRALYVSDLHMSNSLPHSKKGEDGISDRLKDQRNLLYRIFETAKENGCRDIFVLGDLFDHSRVDAITLTTTVRTLSKTPVPIHFVPGNHDGINTRGERFTVEALSEVPNMHYMETYSNFRPEGWICFWPLEFAPLNRTREILSKIRLNTSTVNVLLMHNSIVGCTHVGWKCEEGLGLDPNEATGRFDHVLSGHFHTPQQFGNSGRYLGAPLHLRYDDVGRDAGYWIIDFFKDDGSREETFFDGMCPRFHVLDVGDKISYKEFLNSMVIDGEKIRKGDFIRFSITCTNAKLIKKKQSLELIVSKLQDAGVRASWFHDPVYHHVKRIASKSKDNEVVPVKEMISSYVEAVEVDTRGLDTKQLKLMGQEIFQAVEPKWQG